MVRNQHNVKPEKLQKNINKVSNNTGSNQNKNPIEKETWNMKQLLCRQWEMSKHELEHLSLLHHKLLESPILCISIGMEVTGVDISSWWSRCICCTSRGMVSRHLKCTGIIEQSSRRTNANSGWGSISRRWRRNVHCSLLVVLIIINNRSMTGLQYWHVIDFLISYASDKPIINSISTLKALHIHLIIHVYPKMVEDSGK